MAKVTNAANQGNPEAQFTLGLLHVAGLGVIKDEAQAINWYRKAAKQNHADAQFNLGLMYITGRGVEQNHGQAVQWLELLPKKVMRKLNFT